MRHSALHKVLIIDDDPDVQLLARLSLESMAGYETSVCSSGEDGLKAAAEFCPDLVLLDVMLGDGMDGLETMKALQGSQAIRETPVVLLTARAQPEDLREYQSKGALDVIIKPFDALTLHETIESIWQRFQSERAAGSDETGD